MKKAGHSASFHGMLFFLGFLVFYHSIIRCSPAVLVATPHRPIARGHSYTELTWVAFLDCRLAQPSCRSLSSNRLDHLHLYNRLLSRGDFLVAGRRRLGLGVPLVTHLLVLSLPASGDRLDHLLGLQLLALLKLSRELSLDLRANLVSVEQVARLGTLGLVCLVSLAAARGRLGLGLLLLGRRCRTTLAHDLERVRGENRLASSASKLYFSARAATAWLIASEHISRIAASICWGIMIVADIFEFA